MATLAARVRPTKPMGGAAIVNQPTLHVLVAQVRPCSQALPQLPQFCASIAKSAHVVPQHCCGAPHVEAHTAGMPPEPAEPPCVTAPPPPPTKPPAPPLFPPAAPMLLEPAPDASPPLSSIVVPAVPAASSALPLAPAPSSS